MSLLASALLGGCTAPTAHHLGPLTGIASSPGGSVLVCSQGGVELQRDGAIVWLPAVDGRAIAAAPLSVQDGFVVGGGSPGSAGWLQLVSGAGLWLDKVQVANDVVGCVAVAADVDQVAAGAADGSVTIWLPGSAAPPRRIGRHGGPCRSVLFLDHATLVSAGRDGRLVWHCLQGGETIERLDHTAGIECLALDAEGQLGSGARDGKVRVHERGGRLLRTWQRLGGSVLALLHHDGGWLAGMADGRLLLLHPASESATVVHHAGAPIHAMALCGGTLLLGTQHGLVRLPWPRPAGEPRDGL